MLFSQHKIVSFSIYTVRYIYAYAVLYTNK